MFKSAETLRLAAEMRALQKVASPWREARTTWFDGTPESIEARLASTERVLSFARAGMTEAHMALEREAASARAELKEASHRLMIDFLDDSARVAGKHDADPEMPWKNRDTGEDTPTEHWENLHLSPFADEDDYEGKHRESSRRVAGAHDAHPDGASLPGGDWYQQQPSKFEAPPDGKHGLPFERYTDPRALRGDTWETHGNPYSHAVPELEGRHREDGPEMRREIGRNPISPPGRHRPEFAPEDMDAHQRWVEDHTWSPEKDNGNGGIRPDWRTAAPMTSVGEGGSAMTDMGPAMMGDQGAAVSMSLPGAVAKGLWNGSATTGQEPTPAFNPGPKAASLRLAAAAFIDAQNTRDRDELALRAARHVAGMTGQLPRPVAEAAGRVFVAAVLAGCDCGKDQNCEDCGADAGENCRPWCTGEAAHEDDKADRKKKGHRTAAVLTDFADELMF